MQTPTAQIKKPTSIKVFGPLLLIVIIIIGAGVWLISRQLSTDQLYKYKKFDSYTLGSGPSISFMKPVELKQISKTQDDAELQHVIKTKGSHRGVATSIATAFVITNAAATPEQIQGMAKSLQSPSALGYSVYTRNIVNFLGARTPSGWKNSLGPPKQFTNDNIKSGAWVFGFTSSYQNLLDKGEVIYIVKGSVNYYFLVESTDKNWDYNQQYWPQILNSIKVASL